MKSNNKKVLDQIIMKVFDVGSMNIENVTLEETEEWDSVSHMVLISQLEESFGVKIDGEKLLDLLSYSDIKEWIEMEVEI